MTETEWWGDLIKGIDGARKGGAKIIVDAEDAKTGVGKTGLAVSVAKFISSEFGYNFKKEDMTLSGAHYLDRWREHPGKEQVSVIILDELGGAGAGHARRAMSTQNVELGSAWQLMRKKRIVTIVTLPHWSKADKSLRQQADYRLWCRKEPIGYFKPYEVGADFDDGGVVTDGYTDVERIGFPNLDRHGDPHYQHITEKKDELLESGYFDADKVETEEAAEEPDADTVERDTKITVAQRMRDNGHSARDIADYVDMSHTWVIENTEPAEA